MYVGSCALHYQAQVHGPECFPCVHPCLSLHPCRYVHSSIVLCIITMFLCCCLCRQKGPRVTQSEILAVFPEAAEQRRTDFSEGRTISNEVRTTN